jgi:hypothetical protein
LHFRRIIEEGAQKRNIKTQITGKGAAAHAQYSERSDFDALAGKIFSEIDLKLEYFRLPRDSPQVSKAKCKYFRELWLNLLVATDSSGMW